MEKVLAARRAGIRTVILPERNRKDLFEDIPEDLRRDMSFIFAKNVNEVLDAALTPMDAPKAAKPLKNGARVKTSESAPPSVDSVANVPSNA